MKIANVIECFNEFDDSEFVLDEEYDGEIAFLKLRFIVRSPYFVENVRGEKQFARKYRRQFAEIRKLFIKRHLGYFETQGLPQGGQEPISAIGEIIADLKKSLSESFLIPNQIELASIELMGNWSVFQDENNTILALEQERLILEEVNNKLRRLSLDEK